MALQKQNIPIALTKLDAGRTDPKLLPQGGMVYLENMRPGRDGEYVKRHGVTALGVSTSTGTVLTTGTDLSALTAHAEELVMQSGDTVYSFAGVNDRWYAKGTNIRASVEVRGVASGDMRCYDSSTCYVGGLIVTAWVAQNVTAGLTGVYYSVVDEETGQILVPSTLIENTGGGYAADTSMWPRVVAVGSSAHIYWVRNGPANATAAIVVARVQVATPTTLSAVTTVTGSAGLSNAAGTAGTQLRPAFDALTMGTTVYVVWAHQNGADGMWGVGTVTESLTVGGPGWTTLGAQANHYPFCCGWLDYSGANGKLYFAGILNTAADGLHVQVYSVNTSTLAATAIGNLRNAAELAYARQVTGYHDGTNYQVYWQAYNASVPGASPTSQAIYRGTAVGNGASWLPNAMIAGHMFKVGSTYYLPIVYRLNTTSYQGFHAVVDTSKNLVAVALQGEGGAEWDAYNTPKQSISRVSLISSTVAAVPALRLINAADTGFQPCYFELNLSPTIGPPVVAGDELYVPGAVSRCYDSDRITEAGFLSFPEQPVLAATGAGGSCTAGTHSVKLIFSWRDSLGNLHRSAPSPAGSVSVGGGGNAIVCYFQQLNLTNKTGVFVIAFMTTASGSIYYRCPLSSTLNFANVDSSASTGSLTISVLDAALALQPTLYTEGGVLDNDAWPAANAMFVAKNRLWLVGLDDRHACWFSKEMVSGEGVAMSAFNEIRAEDEYGGFTAGSALDDKVVLFKSHALYVVYGDGPDDTGNGSFTMPQRLPSPFGTESPRSVVEGQPGVFFFYDGTIYLLTRGLEIVPIGLPVRDYTEIATVTSAVVWPEEQEVRFYTAGGRTLVYNWQNDCWTTFSGQLAAASTRWDDTVLYLSTAGVVYQEDDTKYYDLAATAILSTAKTGWISLAGLQGFQRLYTIQVLGEYAAAHTLKISIWYDYATGVASETWTKSVGAGPQRLEVKPSRQTCSAFQVQIEDTYAGASTQGFKLTGLSCIVGLKQGRGRGVTRMSP